MSSLENPFHPHVKGSGETDTEKDVKLVQKLLGDEDAALLASVRGKLGQRTETMPGDIMTDEEKRMLEEAEAKERENVWDRERYVEWAESIDGDEAWVDETFVFNTNGTVETKGSLYLGDIESLLSFPPNLTTIRGFLDLRRITSADNLTLPETVGGYLALSGLTTANNLTLPQTVGDNLNLSKLTTAEHTVWPKHIGGDLYIPRAFSAQAEQLKASGVLKGEIIYTR